MEPIKEIYTIDDYVCTRIKGKLIFVMDIPTKYIKTDEKNREYFDVYIVEGDMKKIVAGAGLYTRYYKGTFNDNYACDFSEFTK